MARRVHKSTDSLSAEALRVMSEGFHAGKTYAAIARDLAEMGVTVPERTIARRGQEWAHEARRRQAAREYVADLVEAAKANPEASAVLGALATDALMSEPDTFTASDPVKVQRLNLKAEELRLKREEMAIRERQVAIDEKRIGLLVDREQRAIQAASELAEKAQRGESLTAEDMDRIREIYGLKTGGTN